MLCNKLSRAIPVLIGDQRSSFFVPVSHCGIWARAPCRVLMKLRPWPLRFRVRTQQAQLARGELVSSRTLHRSSGKAPGGLQFPSVSRRGLISALWVLVHQAGSRFSSPRRLIPPKIHRVTARSSDGAYDVVICTNHRTFSALQARKLLRWVLARAAQVPSELAIPGRSSGTPGGPNDFSED